MIKKYYKILIPEEIRFHISARIHPIQNKRKITQSHNWGKATFSMKKFDALNTIFVHVTKTGGTAIAQSLVGEQPYHHRAIGYRAIYGHKKYKQYFKFGFVRNPWDRLFSAWTYLSQGGWHEHDKKWFEENISQYKTFEEFVMSYLSPESIKNHPHFWPQHMFLCDRNKKIIVDYIGHFETLAADFDYLKNKLGLPASSLTKKNASHKSKRYQDAYTNDMIEKVRSIYADDCEIFSYNFDATLGTDLSPTIKTMQKMV